MSDDENNNKYKYDNDDDDRLIILKVNDWQYNYIVHSLKHDS